MNIEKRPIHKSRYSTRQHKKSGVVIHWLVATASAVDRSFQSKGETSYHYIIDSNGHIRQYPEDVQVAYHAGNWQANLERIGIALEGGYEVLNRRIHPSPEAHQATADLVRHLAQKHTFAINRATVKKHSEVRNSPTACPGTTDIDWIVREAQKTSNNTNDMKYPKGTKEYETRVAEVAYMLIVGVPGATEYIRTQNWDFDKFRGEFEFYAQERNQEEAYDHWRKVVADYFKTHEIGGKDCSERYLAGKRDKAEQVVKELKNLLKKIS